MAHPEDENMPDLAGRESAFVANDGSHNGREISAENKAELHAWAAYPEPLVHRPAVTGISALENSPRELGQATFSDVLVHRPAVPDITVKKSVLVQHPIRPLHHVFRQLQRERRERERLERVRLHKGGYARPGRVENPLGYQSHIKGFHMDLQPLCHTDDSARARDKPRDDIQCIEDKTIETEQLNRVLATEIASWRVARIEVMKDIINLFAKRSTLEEWQEWGEEFIWMVEEEQKEWKVIRNARKEFERTHTTIGGPLSVPRVDWTDKLDKAIEDAELDAEKATRRWAESEGWQKKDMTKGKGGLRNITKRPRLPGGGSWILRIDISDEDIYPEEYVVDRSRWRRPRD